MAQNLLLYINFMSQVTPIRTAVTSHNRDEPVILNLDSFHAAYAILKPSLQGIYKQVGNTLEVIYFPFIFCSFVIALIQRSTLFCAPGLVKFVPAVAILFCMVLLGRIKLTSVDILLFMTFVSV